jgi:predicted neutral ceramidase superfamily lipid hydrolase
MLNIITVIYIAVALIGIFMFISILMKKKLSLIVGIIHGVLGLAGIALLIIVSSYASSEGPSEVIIIFFLAFLLGGGIFAAKVFSGKSNIWINVIHAAVALAGIYLLFQYRSLL